MEGNVPKDGAIYFLGSLEFKAECFSKMVQEEIIGLNQRWMGKQRFHQLCGTGSQAK